jgi:hypothetical protein
VSSKATFSDSDATSSSWRKLVRTIWWARAQAEQPLPGATICPRPDCAKSTASPFDLYCRTGDSPSNEFHFVVAGGNRRVQTFAIYATRALFGLLVLLAARSGSQIPLDIAAGLAGALLLVLPLRRFPVSRVVAPVAWACVFILAVAGHQSWLRPSGEAGATTGILLIAALGLILAVALRRDDGAASVLHRSVSVGLATAIGALLMFIAFALGVGSASAAGREVALLVFVLALGSVVGGTALTGFVVGFHEVTVSDIEQRKAPRLGKPPRLHLSDPAPFLVQTFFARVAFVALVAMFRLVNGLAEALDRAIGVAVDVVNSIMRVCFELEFLLRLAFLWVLRLLGRAAIDAIAALRAAARVVAEVVVRWASSTVLGLALLIGAAQLGVEAAALFESYLTGGALLNGIGAPMLILAMGVALVAIWWTLTKSDLADILRSALHTVEGAGPSLFLTLVALGWIDGIAGMLGFGPIRPGWLTIGGTVVLIVGGSYVVTRELRQRPGRSTA